MTRHLARIAAATVALASCSTRPASTPVTPRPAAGSANANTAPPGNPAVTPVPVGDPRAVAVGWVAGSGQLLAMGPIARSEYLRTKVAAASVEQMGKSLTTDLDRLAAGIPKPAGTLQLVEAPITATSTMNGEEATVDVWSVVVFGAKELGAPRVVFRTSQLILTVEDDGWKLVSFTSTPGPTPVTTDALPSDWTSFATVAAWPAAAGVA
jgi:hypothetical protein